MHLRLIWAVVVAQLAEQSLPTPEICGSNPDIGNKNIVNIFICQLQSRKDKIKKKRPGMAQLKKSEANLKSSSL